MALSIISFNQIYLKLTFDKRRILPNFDTDPFGYIDDDDDDNDCDGEALVHLPTTIAL